MHVGSLFILMLSLEIRRTMSETHIQLLVTPQHDRMRLDTFLSTCSELGARNACAHLIEQGKLKLMIRLLCLNPSVFVWAIVSVLLNK